MKYTVVTFLLVLADQASKAWIHKILQEGESLPMIKPYLYFTYVRNSGAAFGLFAQQTWLLISAGFVALGLVWYYRHQLYCQSSLTRWGVSLALAGVVGNLIDRIRVGHVIDFIDIIIWPVFNIADMAIVGGVALLFWEVLLDARRVKG